MYIFPADAPTSAYPKPLARIQPKRSVVEQWRSDLIARRARRDRVKAQRAHAVPGRHLPRIVVAGEACGCVGILFAHQLADMLLRLPRCSGVVIQICDVVAGFVAVVVISTGEQRVQLGD